MFSSQSILPTQLTLPSIFHPLPTLSAFLFLPLSPATFIRLHSPVYDFTLTFYPSVVMLSSSYITSPFLVSTLHQSCPHFSSLPASLSPGSHYNHSQAPVSCLLPLGISSPCSHSFGPGPLPTPHSSAHLSPFCLRVAGMDTLPSKQVRKK